MQIFYKFFFDPLKIRILNYFFGNYNIIYYPKKIKKIVKDTSKINSSNDLNFLYNIFNLNLESMNQTKFILNEDYIFDENKLDLYWNVNMNSNKIDIEELNASHRFHWIIISLSNNKNVSRVKFIQDIEKWILKFSDNEDKIAWHPYNVSERICNWIIFLHYLDSSNKNIINILLKQINIHLYFLINNLEFPASKKVNNHIVNNIRAIYMGGQFTMNPKLINLAKILLKDKYSDLISINGTLNESSVHYQFLITKSILEIYLISVAVNDKELILFLKSKVKALLESCNFFMTNPKIGMNKIPKIGDVSPDIPFSWFNPFKKNGWRNIWKFCEVEKDYPNNKIEMDGWIKLKKYDWTIFSFSHPRLDEYPSGHGHDDFASINIFFKNQPILIDIGCLSYDNNNYGKKSKDHSTLLINNKSVISPGIGYKSIKSSKSRKLSSVNHDINSITWKGITAENILWSRKLEIISSKQAEIIDICKGNKYKLMTSYFYISNDLKYENKIDNKFKFRLKNMSCDFNFDNDAEIQLQDSVSYDNYGIEKKIKLLVASYTKPVNKSLVKIKLYDSS